MGRQNNLVNISQIRRNRVGLKYTGNLTFIHERIPNAWFYDQVDIFVKVQTIPTTEVGLFLNTFYKTETVLGKPWSQDFLMIFS